VSDEPPRLTTFEELHSYAARLAAEPAFDPGSDKGWNALVDKLSEAIRASPELQVLAARRLAELSKGRLGTPDPVEVLARLAGGRPVGRVLKPAVENN
jgi:hypothetical protein